MAEAAGLALGSVALASLLSSCVEFLEYLENGKNWTKDFQLALTKVSLLKTRLSQWSTSIEMSIDSDSFEAHLLRERWPEESGAIMTTLLGIKEILSSTTQMCKRYDSDKDALERQWRIDKCMWTPEQEQAQGDRACQSPPLLITGPSMSSPNPKEKRSSNSSDLRKESLKDRDRPRRREVIKTFRLKATWALQDKKRFDSLINDFEFLLHNLERIGDRLQLQGEISTNKTLTKTTEDARAAEPEVLENYPAPTVHVADTKKVQSSRTVATSSETRATTMNEQNPNSHRPPPVGGVGEPIFVTQSQGPQYLYQYQHPLGSRGQGQHLYQNNGAYGNSNLFLGDYYSEIPPVGAMGHNYFGNHSHDNSTIHAGNTNANARALIMREKRNGDVKAEGVGGNKH